MTFLTDHIRDTDHPQTYKEHFDIAFVNSCRLIWASIKGLIHGIFPWWYKFDTSTAIVQCFKILVDSGRHTDEFREHLGEGYLLKKHMNNSQK